MPLLRDPRDAHIQTLTAQLATANATIDRLLGMLDRTVPRPVTPGAETPLVASTADADALWLAEHPDEDEEEADETV